MSHVLVFALCSSPLALQQCCRKGEEEKNPGKCHAPDRREQSHTGCVWGQALRLSSIIISGLSLYGDEGK